MMPLVLLQLSLLVVITHSQHYDGSDVYAETSLTAEDIESVANGSYLKAIPDDVKPVNRCSIPLDTDDNGNPVVSNVSAAFRRRRSAYGGPWRGGRIPYAISKSYWGWQKGMIWKAMKEIEDKSCVKFETKSNADRAYIFIAPISGCNSKLGPSTGEGRQMVSIVYGCFTHGSILHELMHALGFDHEHQRNDRNTYVKVNMKNVREGFKSNYYSAATDDFDTYNIDYDYDSVTHYSSWTGCTCTWGWYKTMTKKTGEAIYNAQQLSEKDIKRIKLHYGCEGESTKALLTGQFHHVDYISRR